MIARRKPMRRQRAAARRAAAPLTRTRLTRKKASADAPRVKGRPAVSLPAWRAIVADLLQRCGSRCEVCFKLAALEPHHVVPCSLGGADHVDNVLMVCGGPAGCHRRFDAPFRIGKLCAVPLGRERFRITLEYRADKRGPLLKGSTDVVYTRPDGAF
ncbi:MAG TPA: HNH endonuclease [Terriglobales bacterium]|nr:HNH endonuclease [Terriglobales bacterium]